MTGTAADQPLLQRYRTLLEEAQWEPDPHQQVVIGQLEQLHRQLQTRRSGLHWLRRRQSIPPLGIYLWGDVGRGKTWLMDLFFQTLPMQQKQRHHFHRFMQQVHENLKRHQRKANPLKLVARDMAGKLRVLCLDELQVSDIADAMILAGLLHALVTEGVTLVVTANQPPDELYRDGIQRAGFLPAIDLLQRHTRVIQLAGTRDYRSEILKQDTVYHTPLGDLAEQRLLQEFARLAGTEYQQQGEIRVLSRPIPFRQLASGIVWFDFDALCGPPRSQNDYIEIARSYHTVFLSDIPRLDGSRDDRTRRFIFLVDEFYERNVNLILSADAVPEHLYSGERLAFEFRRTSSRLLEMQGEIYLHQRHKS